MKARYILWNRSRTIIIATVAMLLLLLAACPSGATTTATTPAASPQATATSTTIIIIDRPPTATPVSTPAPQPDVAFEEPFSTRLGNPLTVGTHALRDTFQEVSEDSRCPADVVCIWAGQVIVVVALREGEHNLGSESLIVGNAEESAKKIGDYMVEALVVDPYPVSTGAIAPSDYALTLKVTET